MCISVTMQISIFCIALYVTVITKFSQFKVSQLDDMFNSSKSSVIYFALFVEKYLYM